ncbi:type IVB secretion system protein IcmH/DotU [Mesorhizobium sp. PL10]
MAGGEARQPADDGEDEPTVAVQRPRGAPADMQAGSSFLQGVARVVQQLDTMPERTLVRAAAPLFLIIAQLRNSIESADVPALRRQVTEEMERFQLDAQKAGIDAGNIIAARYILCSAIDETVLMTPWGSRSQWSANSLLNQFHNQTWGGEKVFTMLDQIKGNAEKRLPLLLLIHSCLMLGFEGRYRVLERGRDQLEDLRNELSRTIRRFSQAKAAEPLSKDAVGECKGRKLKAFVPLWMISVGALSLLVIVHVYVDVMLSGLVRPALTKIQTLVTR